MTKEQFIEIVNESLTAYEKLSNSSIMTRYLVAQKVAADKFDKLPDNSEALKKAYQQGYNDGAQAAATDILNK